MRNGIRQALGDVALIVLVGACSSRGGHPAASPTAPLGGGGLPTVAPGVGDGSLPTTPAGANDTVFVTSPPSTTASTVPPTTTTIPPAIIPGNILFDTASSVLKPEAGPYLTQLASQIRAEHPNAYLHFVGHTDSRYDAVYNLDLSRRRAAAVRQWFADHGFPSDHLSAEGVGASQPLVPDRDAAGNYNESAGQHNRAVVIDISGQ